MGEGHPVSRHTYHRQPLPAWLAALDDPDVSKRRQAARVLTGAHEEHAPAATAALCDHLGDPSVFGNLVSYDAKTDRARELTLARRSNCALCGSQPQIDTITYERYTAPSCAA